MPRVLIAAVGEEPTPNLIPLFAQPEPRFDYVQFMLSDKREVRLVAENLQHAIEKDPDLAVTVADSRDLNAWELATARNQVTKAIAHHRGQGREVTVNVTGGTKIMSLASFEAARDAGVPALYVNTEREEIIHFSPDADQRNVPFKVPISIATQFRAAGREIEPMPKSVKASGADRRWADFARYLLANYQVAHVNLIRAVLASCGGSLLTPVAITPKGKSEDAAKRAQEAGLWKWDEDAGTITIASQHARDFLNGGWVEALAFTALSGDSRFDEVLGNVELNGLGELDVVVSRNGRMGIVECKTTGPRAGRTGERSADGMTFVVAKLRMHEVILGGPYAASMFAFASDANFRDWKRICEQYGIPEPLFGQKVRNLADEMFKRLAPGH